RLLFRTGQVWVKLAEQKRPDARAWLPRAEAANPGFAEDVVAGKDLVGAFAGQHDFHAGLPHQPGQAKERRGRRAQDRSFGEPDDLRETAGNVVRSTVDRTVPGAEIAGHFHLESALVMFGA